MKNKDLNSRTVFFTDDSNCKFNETIEFINEIEIDVDDMTATKDINEIDLLNNLRNRLKKKKTFTNVGPTLIIVNPFTFIDNVYGENQIEFYLKKHELENPDFRQKITDPHLYDLVLIAIRELLKPKSKNQSLIISGESGAGKTETTKNAMRVITYFFSKFKSKKEEIPLETKILNCNPILEGFGNAKTVRNDNSSRFGKYVIIKINAKTNEIEGAKMKTYLLEKSRISELNNLERNYHIFYYLLKGGDENLLKKLFLSRNIKNYRYLWQKKEENQIFEVDSIDDKENFKEILECFKSTGFSEEEIEGIFRVVACVLLLGNLNIKIVGNDCKIENLDVFKNICNLLKVNENKLKLSLTKKYLPVQKIFGGIYSEKEIKNFIDSLAKELYNKLFLWIVEKLNVNLENKIDENDIKTIGLLDIFGFECFDMNSIEQLCINYTNEQLQQLFIKDVFESEKKEFLNEGLKDKIFLLDANYKDNKDVIKLTKIFFERLKDLKKDDEIYEMVKNFENDIKNPPKFEKKFAKIKENKFFVGKFKSLNFLVEHSAKNVNYNSKNFVEKNKDEIKESVIDCLLESKDEEIKMIFTNSMNLNEIEKNIEKIINERKNVSTKKIANKFLGMKFCNEMRELKKELKKCDHHYIRCLKPNEEKKSLLFFANFVFNQIKYLGILATIQVRKNGFPIRRNFDDFCENFKYVVDFDENDKKIKSQKIIEKLLENENFKDEILFGINKVYLKEKINQILEMKKNNFIKLKINSKEIIKISAEFLKKKEKIKKINENVFILQNYFKTNKQKIKLNKKIENIQKIQSFFYCKKEKKDFFLINENYKIIQNNLKILLSKKIIKNKEKLLNILKLNLLIFNNKIKFIHKKKAKNSINFIIENLKEKIIDYENKKIWNKIFPFFKSFLIKKKYEKLSKNAKLTAKKILIENVFKIFENKLLIKKINQKKQNTKKLFIFASSLMFKKYYFQMRKNSIIIQKYLNVYLNKQRIFEKLNKNINFQDENENIQFFNEIFPNFNNNNNNNQIIDETIENSNYLIESQNSLNSTFLNNNINNYTINNNTINNNTISTKNIENSKEKSTIKTTKTTKKNHLKNKKISQNFLKIENYNEGKIKIFARILDIDIITSNMNEINEISWSEIYTKIYKENMEKNTPIQIIKISNTHNLLINNKGKVFLWGWNNFSQCGINKNLTEIDYLIPENKKIFSLPVLNFSSNSFSLKVNNIKKGILNDDFTMLLNENGSVFLFGSKNLQKNNFSNEEPFLLNKFKEKIKEICSTENFNFIVTKNNEIFFWSNTHEFLINNPTKIYINQKISIININSGKNFAIFLSNFGKCFGIGSNYYYEIGMNEKNFRMFPEEIVNLSKFNERIIQIKCGFKHSVALSQNGKIFVWGNNSFGQLGNKNLKNLLPNLLCFKDKIIQISAGFRNSVFMNEKREIYFCGILSKNQKTIFPKKFNFCEKNSEVNFCDFSPVRILSSFSRNMSIFYVSMADLRELNEKMKNKSKIINILNVLAQNWKDENVNGPFISSISKYFSNVFMKIQNN